LPYMSVRADRGSPASSAVVVVDSRRLQHGVWHLIRSSDTALQFRRL